MASSEQQCLRFFVLACCFGLLVGAIGCATNNWSKPLFPQNGSGSRHTSFNSNTGTNRPHSTGEEPATLRQQWGRFWKAGFGTSAGIDPKAREIEKSLGY